MDKVIHFKTSIFDVSLEEKNPINPIYGSSLLQWLKDKLPKGVAITAPDYEDWGWWSDVNWHGNIYMIGSNSFYEEGDDPKGELDWVFQIKKYRSFKDVILFRNKMTDTDECFVYFKDLLRDHPEIKEMVIE